MSEGIRQRLLRSHLAVGLIGVGLLCVGLWSVLWLRSEIGHLIGFRSPVARNSMLALSGIQRSLAALRGWVVLGDSTFKIERIAAWGEEIGPAISELKSLSWQSAGEDGGNALQKLVSVLRDLEEWQWWIEDVAQTPGNEPARVIYLQNVRPVADLFMTGITSLIALHDVDYGRPAVLTAAQELRFLFMKCQTDLTEYVNSGDRAAEERFYAAVNAAAKRLKEITAMRSWLTPEQREVIAWMEEEFMAYKPYAMRAIATRKAPAWNIGQHWLRTEANPSARQVTDFLSILSREQTDLMQEDAAFVTSVSNGAAAISFGLIASMAAAAYIFSKRGAARLTRPIEALSAATQEFAAGRLTKDIPVTTRDELGRLTTAFNRMRASLEQKTADLESFSYSVSHDLRTPLRAIDGFSRILTQNYADKQDAEFTRLLAIVRENARKMGQLIDDLLAFSRLGRQEIRITNVNMRELAQSVFSELQLTAPDRHLQFNVGQLPAARGDRAMLRQVFVNLISNAIKFTEFKDPAIIEVGHRIDDTYTVYHVKDNGVGFDMEYVGKLFGVFQRLHSDDEFEGSGVGLALVHRVVQRHGGRAWAEGSVNGGATIYFTLPK